MTEETTPVRINRTLLDEAETLLPVIDSMVQFQHMKTDSQAGIVRAAMALGIERLREIQSCRCWDCPDRDDSAVCRGCHLWEMRRVMR